MLGKAFTVETNFGAGEQQPNFQGVYRNVAGYHQ